MSSQVVIYPNTNNGISVVTPAPQYLQDHTIEELAAKDVPPGLPYEVIDASTLPAETAFFNAWVADFNDFQGTSIDLEKAKSIYSEQVTLTSGNLLAPLTQNYLILLATGGDTTGVSAEIQVINDAAQDTSYEAAVSVADLISYWPSILGPNPYLPATASGVLFTGRGAGLGPEDLNVSYYVEFNSVSLIKADTELYVPGTDTVIPYVVDPETGEGTFDSAGNCFNSGDYLVQIRQAFDSRVIADFEVPFNPTGQNVVF